MLQWRISFGRLCLIGAVLSPIWGGGLWMSMPAYAVGGLVVWLPFWGLGVVALMASIVDWRSGILPDVFTLYAGIPVIGCYIGALMFVERSNGISENLWLSPMLGAVYGFVLLKVLQWILRHQYGGEQIGSGDAKLMLVLGAMVDPCGLLPMLIVAFLLLCVFAKFNRCAVLPFGPALTASACLVTLFDLKFQF